MFLLRFVDSITFVLGVRCFWNFSGRAILIGSRIFFFVGHDWFSIEHDDWLSHLSKPDRY